MSACYNTFKKLQKIEMEIIGNFRVYSVQIEEKMNKNKNFWNRAGPNLIKILGAYLGA